MDAQSIVAIVQVRMSSKRLPGKAMLQLAGKTVLQHVLDRLHRCTTVDSLWIATSNEPIDDAIADFATVAGVNIHRGDLNDVASRMLGAAVAAKAHALVRVSADSPLIDPEIVERAVTLYRREKPDLVTNVLHRTYPKGQSVEVIAVTALARACKEMTSAADREHVTTWFYANPTNFRVVGFESESLRGSLQLSIDTPQDLSRIEAILSLLGKPAASHGLEAILAAADSLEPRELNGRE